MSVISWGASSRWQCTTAAVNCLLASWINVKERCEDFSKVSFLFFPPNTALFEHFPLIYPRITYVRGNFNTQFKQLPSFFFFFLEVGKGKGEIFPALLWRLMVIHYIGSLRRGLAFSQLPPCALMLCLQWGQWFYIIFNLCPRGSWISYWCILQIFWS